MLAMERYGAHGQWHSAERAGLRFPSQSSRVLVGRGAGSGPVNRSPGSVGPSMRVSTHESMMLLGR